jgi:outer membrane protein assembly factor BamB
LSSEIDVPLAVSIVPRPPESTTYGRGPKRLFYNPDEKIINRDTAGDLIPKWRYTTGAIITGSPAVAWVRLPDEGPTRVAYTVSWDGNVYALRLRNGTRVWQFTTKPHPGASYPYASSPTVEWLGDRRVVYVGAGMTMYCLDAATGEEIWQFDAGTGCTTCDSRTERNQIESSPAVYDGLVYFGMDINDSGPGKGGLFAVRADDGRLVWYFDLETDTTCRPFAGDNIRRFDGYHTAEQLGLPEDFLSTRPGCDFDRRGTACGNVWSSASIDPERGLLYIASSNCDTDDDPDSIPPPPPMPPYDRALFAVTLDGDPAWVWRPSEVDNDDFSFGGVPNLFTIDFEGEPREVVGIGNKNGTYYVVDRDGVNEVNGVTASDDPEIRNPLLPYWERNVVAGGSIGGIIASAAVNEDERKVFFSTAIGLDIGNPQYPAAHALNLDDGSIAWQNEDVPPSYAPTGAVRGLAFMGTIGSAVINIFDSDDGRLRGSVDTKGQLGGTASVPAIVGGLMVAGGGVGEFGSRPSSQNCDLNPFTGYCQAILDKPLSAFCVRGTLGCDDGEPCDDGNVCTYDYRADDGECTSEPTPNTLECGSGPAKGLCQEGACAVASP